VIPREDIPTSVSDVAGEDLTGRSPYYHLSWSPCRKSRSRTNPERIRGSTDVVRSKIQVAVGAQLKLQEANSLERFLCIFGPGGGVLEYGFMEL
jgi:hypothetical protein